MSIVKETKNNEQAATHINTILGADSLVYSDVTAREAAANSCSNEKERCCSLFRVHRPYNVPVRATQVLIGHVIKILNKKG